MCTITNSVCTIISVENVFVRSAWLLHVTATEFSKTKPNASFVKSLYRISSNKRPPSIKRPPRLSAPLKISAPGAYSRKYGINNWSFLATSSGAHLVEKA